MALWTAATATPEPAGADLAAFSRPAGNRLLEVAELGFNQLGQLFLVWVEFRQPSGRRRPPGRCSTGPASLDGDRFLNVLAPTVP